MFKIVLVSALVALATAAPPSLPRLDGRIVGGADAEIEEYPHQLSLLYYGSHICGASIISERFAVTAAHCTSGSTASVLSVRAGSSLRGKGGVTVQVKKIYQNPQFDSWNIDYDITVLELSTPLEMGPAIQPVALPALNENIPAGSQAICTGWGALREGGSAPIQLQAVTVDIVSQQACKQAYGDSAITDRMICAGVNGGGKDACQGDSGGPLIVDGSLVGIVSWGYGCARPTHPGVYSSVPNLRNYITETAGI